MIWTENNREIDALVRLMDEPNDAIYIEILRKIIGHGSKALPVLEEAWLHTFGGQHSDRLENAIEEIKFHQTVSEIFQWLDNKTLPPTELIHVISSYLYEQYQPEDQQNWIDQIYRNCWLELNESLTALEKTNIINHIFYKVFDLTSFLPDKNQFEGFFFDYMQNNKKSNALLIGLLYLTIAQKLKLPISGINLPNQFVLAYLDIDDTSPEVTLSELELLDIQFYINPSNSGAIFTPGQIRGYLKHIDVSEKKEYFLPCSRKTICIRYLDEVHQGLITENRITKAQYIQSLIQILNETPDELGNTIS